MLAIALPAHALEDAKLWPEDKPKNFCENQEKATANENLAKQHPTDERLIKLVALRAGLCDLLGKQIIELDLAIDVFEHERTNQMMKRVEEIQSSDHEIDL